MDTPEALLQECIDKATIPYHLKQRVLKYLGLPHTEPKTCNFGLKGGDSCKDYVPCPEHSRLKCNSCGYGAYLVCSTCNSPRCTKCYCFH